MPYQHWSESIKRNKNHLEQNSNHKNILFPQGYWAVILDLDMQKLLWILPETVILLSQLVFDLKKILFTERFKDIKTILVHFIHQNWLQKTSGCFQNLNSLSKEGVVAKLVAIRSGLESNSARRIFKRFCETSAFLVKFLGSTGNYFRTDNIHKLFKHRS